MAVDRPTYKDSKTGKLKQQDVWWFEFTFAGKRIRESAKTTRKTIATKAEERKRLELERAYAGLPIEAPEMRINSVLDCTKAYRKAYEQGHRQKSLTWVAERLPHVEKALGNVLLPELTRLSQLRGLAVDKSF